MYCKDIANKHVCQLPSSHFCFLKEPFYSGTQWVSIAGRGRYFSRKKSTNRMAGGSRTTMVIPACALCAGKCLMRNLKLINCGLIVKMRGNNHVLILVCVPIREYPSWWQTTAASLLSQHLSQRVCQVSLEQISRVPCSGTVLYDSLTLPDWHATRDWVRVSELQWLI